jgi:uncharacterized protein
MSIPVFPSKIIPSFETCDSSNVSPLHMGVAVAVFAKAPVSGYAQTNLTDVIGGEKALEWQRRLTRHAVSTAIEADVGPVALWCAPKINHPFFLEIAQSYGVILAGQTFGDLGERMMTAFRLAPSRRPLLIVGTDCPSLTASHIREAATALTSGAHVVMTPDANGGYALVGARRPYQALFDQLPWGSEDLAEITRERAQAMLLDLREFDTVTDGVRGLQSLEGYAHATSSALRH